MSFVVETLTVAALSCQRQSWSPCHLLVGILIQIWRCPICTCVSTAWCVCSVLLGQGSCCLGLSYIFLANNIILTLSHTQTLLTPTHPLTHTLTSLHKCSHTHTLTHLHPFTHAHTYIPSYIPSYTFACSHTHTFTHSHSPTHTHSQVHTRTHCVDSAQDPDSFGPWN